MSKTSEYKVRNVFKFYNTEADVLMIDYEGHLDGFITDPEDNPDIARMIEHTLYPSLI
ncbi:MAG: hypothetical protein K9W44_06895 [Candidatus Lokiarchaeota archaeon]|nr:hypothetical protein [Candidatus Harpocratesius repetitus]